MRFSSCFFLRAVDSHSFLADPDPSVLLNADPDPAAFKIRIRIQLKQITIPSEDFSVVDQNKRLLKSKKRKNNGGCANLTVLFKM